MRHFILREPLCLSRTVFAKPPSEPKLSQLSSDEEEVSMGMSEELRKLLKAILVDGGWTSSFCEEDWAHLEMRGTHRVIDYIQIQVVKVLR